MFKQWSENNKATPNRSQTYRFYYKNASPPKKISEIAALAGANTASQNKTKEKAKGLALIHEIQN